jgi:HEAT repeat protein
MGQRLPDGVASELLLAVSDRRIFFAKDVVVASLGSTAPAVRSQALKSLRTVGTPSNVSAVLDLLVKSDDDAERGEAEKTAAALTLKVANPDGRSRAVRARLTASTTASERARLIAVLPLTGDPGALPALRTALADADPEVADAAARALAAWPTAAAREDLLQLARDSKNETHRLLAITGFVRTVGLEPSRIPAVAVADLKTAGDLAWRPEERKLVLGALVAFPCREALDAANGWLGDPAVKAEAQAAVEKITERLAKK